MINREEIKNLVTLNSYDIKLAFNQRINKKKFTIFAGPCRVESLDQCKRIAEFLKENGAHIFRAGAFKPCTHPHCDLGLEEKGLEILEKIRELYQIPIISEAMSIEQLEKVSKVADIIQIGMRNAQNYNLLKELHKYDKPVFYKRGSWMNLREVLAGLEWIIYNNPNKEVILCERGTVHFNNHMRWTLDYTIVPSVREYTQIPIVIDISHGTGGDGNKRYYNDLARAAVAIGADGLMVEVHYNPDESYSDKVQTLNFSEFKELINYITPVVKAVGKEM